MLWGLSFYDCKSSWNGWFSLDYPPGLTQVGSSWRRARSFNWLRVSVRTRMHPGSEAAESFYNWPEAGLARLSPGGSASMYLGMSYRYFRISPLTSIGRVVGAGLCC